MATDPSEVQAAQRLRYDVFVAEMGADGPLVDHDDRLERDRFDPYFDHLLLYDRARPDDAQVVGVYRVMRRDQADAAGQFYSEDEYDLDPLKTSGKALLELGRSCVHADYRGGAAMYHLWAGLASYVETHGIEVLFGVASFHGRDVSALAQPLSYLHHHHLAPEDIRVRTRGEAYQSMNLLPAAEIDRKAAMIATPSLIKGYLRLGGFVGDGAFIDHDFNTTDVCLIVDTARMNAARTDLYTRAR